MTSSSGVENSPERPAVAPEASSGFDGPPSADEHVPCPLCYYNLRGQLEPRCPECGYRFEWHDLRDPARRRHPYLFEHHPRRNVWSLWRTFVGALRPRRFWGELRPGQPSEVRRLVAYWFLVSLFALALPLAVVAMDMVRLATFNYGNHIAQRSLTFGASQAWLDAMHPLPPSPAFFKQYFSTMRSGLVVTVLAISIIYAAWPWLTFLALNVFGISMLHAKVKASHVLRCVSYTFDAVSLLGWALLLGASAVMGATWFAGSRGSNLGIGDEAVAVTIFVWSLTAVALFTHRLSIAYRLYLQFHRPFLTALTSQIIVALFVLTALLWILVLE